MIVRSDEDVQKWEVGAMRIRTRVNGHRIDGTIVEDDEGHFAVALNGEAQGRTRSFHLAMLDMSHAILRERGRLAREEVGQPGD